jgi:endonuclease/exonuclease/phosphatase family metal-dependent hydrolase
MKYYKLLVILLSLSFLSVSRVEAQTTETSTELTVVSWNIQMLPNFFRAFSADLRKRQRQRTPWIINYIKEKDYDVWVLQEVFDQDICRRLRRRLKAQYPYQIRPINKGRLTSNGILILSKYPIKKLGHVVYEKGVGADKMAAKGCVLIELEKEGKKIQIAGTHLQAGGSEERMNIRAKQFLKIRELLDEYQQEGVPQLLAGDMNTRKSRKDRYQLMMKSIQMQDFPMDEEEPYTIDGNNSWKSPAHEPIQLDYIFLAFNNTIAQIKKQKILRPKRRHKGAIIDLADHYGVVAFIEW